MVDPDEAVRLLKKEVPEYHLSQRDGGMRRETGLWMREWCAGREDSGREGSCRERTEASKCNANVVIP